MSEIIFIVVAIVQILTLFLSFYYFVISVASLIKRKEDNADDFESKNKFAVLIPAHNEEAVIASVINSVLKQNYPKKLFDVYVIADNCTDKTADIACKYNVTTITRFNKNEIGKVYALDNTIDIIKNNHKNYTAYAFIDADNLVDPNFLKEMNKELCKGNKAVQGYVDSKNPFDSWITSSYTLCFSYLNRIFQMSRYYLGLTNIIFGSGFVVNSEIIEKYGFDAYTLTEDLEYTLRLNMKDIKISFAPHEVVYAENPLDMTESWYQRKRWAQGQMICMKDYFIPLVKKGIKEKNLKAIDCAIYSFNIFRILSLCLSTIFAILPFIFKDADLFSYGILFPSSIWMVLSAAQLIYGPLLISCEKKMDVKLLITLILYPIYNLTWIPITLEGLIDYDKKEWFHTKHNRNVDLDEIKNEDI